jgi:GT2 family glycosyltransferase
MNHESDRTLSLGVSIVLYRTSVAEIAPLIDQILKQGARQLYLIDNSVGGFDAFEGWSPPERVITLSTRQNLGYGKGHNLAIRDSVRRHRYHVVCNPDITLADDTLPALFALFESRPEVGLCNPRVVLADGTLYPICKRAPSPFDFIIRQIAPESWFPRRRAYYEMRDLPYDQEMEPQFLSGCFMFARSDVLRQVGGFDERYFLYMEDLDLSRRAARLAKVIYYPHNQIVHVHQRGSHKSLRLFVTICVSAWKYFNKWGWFEQPWFRVRRAPVSSPRGE